MLTFEEHNILEQIINKNWGRSSTGFSGSPEWIIDCRVIDEGRVQLSYQTIVNMSHPAEMHQRKQRLEEEALGVIDNYIAGTKRLFRQEAGRALKLKLADHFSSVEFISMSAHNPKKTAYFRVQAIAEYE